MALPYVDEHAVVVAAAAEQVWRVLGERLDDSLSRGAARRCARAVGAVPASSSGPRPLSAGSTLPGFVVVSAAPGSSLTLEGRHRFSTYALSFRLDALAADRCRLTAQTRAAFPGIAGALYRAAVIGSGGHAAAVRRILHGVRRRAERRRAG